MPTSKVDREIATIKADVAAMGHLFKKLDDAIEKIGEASNNISQILAVHEERLDSSERYQMERRKVSEEAVKDLHSRITTASRESQQDMKSHTDKILESIEKLRTHVDKENDHIQERITRLEQWRWILMGGALVLGMMAGNMEIVKLFG